MSYAYKGNIVMKEEDMDWPMKLQMKLYDMVILHDSWVGPDDVGQILYNHATGHHFTILECRHQEFMVWGGPKTPLKSEGWQPPINHWEYRKFSLIKTSNQKLLLPGDVFELML